jgi:curli biogenesis system outer membrane secretion channel CsgG
MCWRLLVFILVVQGCFWAQTAPPPANSTPAAAVSDNNTDSSALLKVKRIYVDSFGEDAVSKELQAMIVSSLVASKRFKVTENRERADAVLKGNAIERTSQEIHAYGDSTNVGEAAGGSHGQVSGSWANGTGSVSGSSHGGFIARHMGTSDSSLNTETINNARIAIRLVNLDGDVIWTTTHESKGAKYKGATADAADMCIRKLIRDLDGISAENQAGRAQPALTTPVQASPSK